MTPPLAVCLAGHVDHGKSSLLGRLLHELDLLPEGKAAKLEAASASRGVPLEWSSARDALQPERDQAVTLDTTRVHVRTPRRQPGRHRPPGHRELARNLVTGAAGTTAALLVVDGPPGAEARTRAHAAQLRLLGVRDFVVAVNKMDALDWSEERFQCPARRDCRESTTGRRRPRHRLTRRGTAATSRRAPAAWWRGHAGDALEACPASNQPTRGAAATARPGCLYDGNALGWSPAVLRKERSSRRRADGAAFRRTRPCRRRWRAGRSRAISAVAGDNVALTFSEPVIVERGDLLCAPAAPARLTPVFDADMVWLGRETLAAGRRFELRVGARAVAVRVAAVIHALDSDRLDPRRDHIATNGLGRVTLRCDLPVAVDDATECLETGRFVLADAGVSSVAA